MTKKINQIYILIGIILFFLGGIFGLQMAKIFVINDYRQTLYECQYECQESKLNLLNIINQ